MSATLSSRMDLERAAQVRALLVETVEGTASHQLAARPRKDPGAGTTELRRRRVPRSITFAAIAVGAVGLGTGAALRPTLRWPSTRTWGSVWGFRGSLCASCWFTGSRSTRVTAVTPIS